MQIVFCGDRHVIPGLHVAAYSLLQRYHPDAPPPRFTVFSDSLTEGDRQLLEKTLVNTQKPFTLDLRPIEVSQFSHFPPLNNSWATYYRLHAFQHMAGDRLLYVDADTLCDIDVSPLASLDLGTAPAAWVPEAPLPHAIDRPVAQQLGNNPQEFYFNAGVMLINLPVWRQQQISENAMHYIATHRPLFHDQSALNVLLHRRAIALDARFNCFANVRQNWPALTQPLGHINRLIHFLDYPKPWDFLAEWLHPQHHLWKAVLSHTELKDFSSWQSLTARPLSLSKKQWQGYQKSTKDRLLFLSYQQGWLAHIKGI